MKKDEEVVDWEEDEGREVETEIGMVGILVSSVEGGVVMKLWSTEFVIWVIDGFFVEL